MRKLEKIKPFGHSKAPKKKKIGQILLIFPVLGKTTHIHCRTPVVAAFSLRIRPSSSDDLFRSESKMSLREVGTSYSAALTVKAEISNQVELREF